LSIQNAVPSAPEAVCDVVIPEPEVGDEPPNGISILPVARAHRDTIEVERPV
jgi:hypothetical protein